MKPSTPRFSAELKPLARLAVILEKKKAERGSTLTKKQNNLSTTIGFSEEPDKRAGGGAGVT